MGLKLLNVPPAQGLRWLQQGVRQFLRQPLAFGTLLTSFMLGALVLSMVPVGSVLVIAAVPLLSLAFMHGTHECQQGHVPRLAVLLAMWRPPVPLERRRTLALLCGLYAALTVLGLELCELVDDGALARAMDALAGGAEAEQVNELVNAPGVMTGLLARLGITALLGIPFWHAPALVLWGGQPLGQALFSSALAVWRARSAFLIYGLAWMALVAGSTLTLGIVMGLLNLAAVSGMLMVALGLLLSTAYYVSLYFTFVDSFGPPQN